MLKNKYFNNFTLYEKEKGHIASDADMEVELFIKEELFKIDPSIGFYGEELGGIQSGKARWIVDSLDGTANFIFGVPYFCTSIALEKENKIISALVYNPVSDELFEAYEGKHGAFLNNSPIQVSETKILQEAKVVFGFSANFNNITRYHNEWGTIFDNCLKGLGLLSPAMNLCNVARGRIDVFIDFGSSMEGQAAGGYILQKAGGKVFNYDKSPWTHSATGVIAANSLLEL